MKKIVAFFILICVIFSLYPLQSLSEEDYVLVTVNMSASDEINTEHVVVKNYEIYLAADRFCDYTRYNFDNDTLCYYIGEKIKRSIRKVIISSDNKKAKVLTSINNTRSVEYDLSDCIQIDDTVYLPVSQMLPILGAELYAIEDNTIKIANNPVSIFEILNDFDLEDYKFDYSKEFLDSAFLAWGYSVAWYLFDTVTGCRYNRLAITSVEGSFADYKQVFMSYIENNDLYLKAMSGEEPSVVQAIDCFQTAGKVSKKLHSVYSWIKAANDTSFDVVKENGGVLFDALSSISPEDYIGDDLYGLTEAMNSGSISLVDVIDTLQFICLYLTHVEDNRLMLNAVYSFDESNTSSVETRAANRVYDLFGENMADAIAKNMIDKFISEDFINSINPFKVYTATAKLAGTIIGEYIKQYGSADIEGTALLPYYAETVNSSSMKYHTYSFDTEEGLDNARLSLLMCMIASKKCYDIMGANASGNNKKYYNNKSRSIDEIICNLYVAGLNTSLDSYESIQDNQNNIKEKLKESILIVSLSTPNSVSEKELRYISSLSHQQIWDEYIGVAHNAIYDLYSGSFFNGYMGNDNRIIIEDDEYWLVNDVRFTNYQSFEGYLHSLFTDELIERILSETPIINYNNQIYEIPRGKGSVITIYDANFYYDHYEHSSNSVVFRVDAEYCDDYWKYNGPWPFPGIEVDPIDLHTEIYYYSIQKVNGKWLLSDFEFFY